MKGGVNNSGMMVHYSINQLPACRKCNEGELLPIQDVFRTESGIVPYYKGWICSNCGYNIVFKAGDIIHLKIKSES